MTEKVRCACCPEPAPGEPDRREVLATVRDGHVVIVARRHGRRHVAVVPCVED